MNGLSVPAKKLSSYKGKPLIINVWASWCGPCRKEMPSLDKLARRYGGKQFNVIGISTDDYPEKAYSFLEQAGVPFDNFIDRNLVLENMLGANKLPLTLLVDRNGKVLSKHYGAQDWSSDEAKRLIEKSFNIRM
jgi:thiol-disulfide isomerase/thioredoxin